MNYLAYDQMTDDYDKNTEETFSSFTFVLSDKKTIKSRTVYNFITLVSEVSGFADLFFVAAGIFFYTFYTPRMLEAKLLEHVGLCELPKAQKPKHKTFRKLPAEVSK